MHFKHLRPEEALAGPSARPRVPWVGRFPGVGLPSHASSLAQPRRAPWWSGTVGTEEARALRPASTCLSRRLRSGAGCGADPDRGWQRCGPRGVAVASEPVAAAAGAPLRGCAGGREVAAVSGALLRRVSPKGPSPHRWFTNRSPRKFEAWRLRPERPFSTPAAPGPSFAQTSPAHPPPPPPNARVGVGASGQVSGVSETLSSPAEMAWTGTTLKALQGERRVPFLAGCPGGGPDQGSCPPW